MVVQLNITHHRQSKSKGADSLPQPDSIAAKTDCMPHPFFPCNHDKWCVCWRVCDTHQIVRKLFQGNTFAHLSCSPYFCQKLRCLYAAGLLPFQLWLYVIRPYAYHFGFDASSRGQLSELPLERHVSAMLRVPADPVSVSLQRFEGGLHCSLLQECPQSVWPLYHSPRYTLQVHSSNFKFYIKNTTNGFLSAFLLFLSSWGCSLFENCKTCHNGTWKANDDFFINGKYCTDCRQGWSGGDCKSELCWWITHECCRLCLAKLAELHLLPITDMESMAQTTNLPAVPHFSLSCSHKHLVLSVVVIEHHIERIV